MPIDLKLDLDENDLTIENYDLALVDKLEQINQKLQIKLKFFSGEWFLDTTQGVPFYSIVFVKNPDLDLIATTIKNEILKVDGIKEILSYSQQLDTVNRTLSVDFEVDTIYGTTEQTVEIF